MYGNGCFNHHLNHLINGQQFLIIQNECKSIQRSDPFRWMPHSKRYKNNLFFFESNKNLIQKCKVKIAFPNIIETKSLQGIILMQNAPLLSSFYIPIQSYRLLTCRFISTQLSSNIMCTALIILQNMKIVNYLEFQALYRTLFNQLLRVLPTATQFI